MSAARIRVVLCVAALGCGGEQADRVDLLLAGGSVYTLDWPSPSAEGRPSAASPWTEAPDPFRAEPARLLTNGRVVLTIVDGRIVHEAGSR